VDGQTRHPELVSGSFEGLHSRFEIPASAGMTVKKSGMIKQSRNDTKAARISQYPMFFPRPGCYYYLIFSDYSL
jgi:hypothetical protein